jgi:hypothetical protein
MDPSESIASQLAEITATSEDGEHLLLMEPNVRIILSDMHGMSGHPREAAAYLSVGEWGAEHLCPGHMDCVLWSHVSDAPMSDPPATVEAEVLSEAEEDQLVRKASRPTLASLYKGARAKGLVPASPASGASGYF